MKKLIKALITLFLLLAITFVIAGLFFLRWIVNCPADAGNNNHVVFEVKEGQTSTEIAENLESKKLVKSGWAFLLNTKFKEKPLLAGYYNLSPSMTTIDIFNKLTSSDISLYKITIPEGYRAEQIAQVLDEKKIVSYDDFVKAAKGNEGKLFPDTYFLPAKMPAAEIIKMMEDNYTAKISGLSVTDEDLIIASLVEREAVKDEERPIIAGVYKNRIAKGMKLEADPTVQYGKDDLNLKKASEQEKINFHFWGSITKADYLTVDSPYNTYIIDSLPPTPICNPGLKSIEATISYTKHNYLYFLQNNGQIYPSTTIQEHDANRAKVLGVKTKSY